MAKIKSVQAVRGYNNDGSDLLIVKYNNDRERMYNSNESIPQTVQYFIITSKYRTEAEQFGCHAVNYSN